MDKEKLLGDLPISHGTGKQIAENIFQLLQDWNIGKKIIRLSFDATSANAGCENGANVYLEMFLEIPFFGSLVSSCTMQARPNFKSK